MSESDALSGDESPMRCSDHIKNKSRLPYVEWHEKATASLGRGEQQKQCTQCRHWFFWWEMKKRHQHRPVLRIGGEGETKR